MTKKLTDKERRFVELYLIYADVRKAAEEAGFSATVAQSKAYMWVSDGKAKPHVYAAVRNGQRKLTERAELSQAAVIEELRRIGFADIRKVARWGDQPAGGEDPSYPVSLVPSGDVDEETAAAIAEVSLTQGGVKLKMHDKLGALDKLARHLGMYQPDAAAPDVHVHIHQVAQDF